MTQLKALNAYQLILQMYKTKGLPFSVSKALFIAKTRLQPHIDCQVEQENLLIEEFGCAVDERGTITPPDDKKHEFMQRMRDIRCANVDIEPVSIDLAPDIIEKLGITGEMLEILDGIIDITEVK